jgi:dihydropteroate synthase
MVATGWPVLVSVSEKDFIGETLGVTNPEDRLTGTLAAMSVCAWLGARVFRVHSVPEAVETLKAVSTIRGDAPPERAVRGLA